MKLIVAVRSRSWCVVDQRVGAVVEFNRDTLNAEFAAVLHAVAVRVVPDEIAEAGDT